MECICEYCKEPFIPKRTDARYCSHSCRQLSYVLRKAVTKNTLGEVKDSQNGKKTSMSHELVKDDPSIKSDGKENYPSTGNEKLTDKEPEPSINQVVTKNYPSITKEIIVKKENELSVNPSITEQETVNNAAGINTSNVNNPVKTIEQAEKYIEYSSPFINEIAELTEERNHYSVLYSFLHNRKESFAYWISLRYRCLLECLLTLSEMHSVELDDLKEICNALTAVIQSKQFQCMIPEYPYIKEIPWLRDIVKNLCLNAEEEVLTFRLKKETKLKLIAARWELSNYVPKIGFDKLNFTE